MDHRFPKYLRFIARKLDFIAIPNLGMLICGLAVLGFIGTNMLSAPLERFTFDPTLVGQGEWWRLFAFPTAGASGNDNPIYLIFFVLYVYFVMGMMESTWGTSPLTLYTLLGYVAAIAASFFAQRPISIWFQVMENISLAFGTLFPDLELYLFFVLPVKAKWLALFAGALFVLQFLLGSWETKAFLTIVLSPYLLFFSPMLYKSVKLKYEISRNRRRMK